MVCPGARFTAQQRFISLRTRSAFVRRTVATQTHGRKYEGGTGRCDFCLSSGVALQGRPFAGPPPGHLSSSQGFEYHLAFFYLVPDK